MPHHHGVGGGEGDGQQTRVEQHLRQQLPVPLPARVGAIGGEGRFRDDVEEQGRDTCHQGDHEEPCPPSLLSHRPPSPPDERGEGEDVEQQQRTVIFVAGLRRRQPGRRHGPVEPHQQPADLPDEACDAGRQRHPATPGEQSLHPERRDGVGELLGERPEKPGQEGVGSGDAEREARPCPGRRPPRRQGLQRPVGEWGCQDEEEGAQVQGALVATAGREEEQPHRRERQHDEAEHRRREHRGLAGLPNGVPGPGEPCRGPQDLEGGQRQEEVCPGTLLQDVDRL